MAAHLPQLAHHEGRCAALTSSTEGEEHLSVSSTVEYSVELVHSVRDVLALRNEWQMLPNDPNADMDFYLTVVNSHSEILRPHVIVLRRWGVLKSIVVGRIELRPLELAVGYKRLSTPPVRILMLIHGGVLGEDSEQNSRLIVDSIKETLRSGEAEIAWFYGVDPSSAFYRVANATGGLLTHDFWPTQLKRWKGRLPESYEELYRKLSANTRHNLSRYSKRLRQSFGDQLTIRSFRSSRDVSTMLSDTEAIASRTYHRGLRVGFVHNNESQQLVTLAANHGWLRAYILYIAGTPLAFWNGFLYRRTFFTWTTGYNPDFADFRPGTFLLQQMLKDLCSERTADEVDFGFGDAQYKRDWCDQEQMQASFLLFAPTLKGIALNCFRTPFIGVSTVARTLLARTGFLQRVKKEWREHLTGRGTSEDGHS